MTISTQPRGYVRPGDPESLVSLKPSYKNFIGGRWVPPTTEQYSPNPSPATGEVFTQVPRSSAQDIELALDAAHAAKDAWGETSLPEGELLLGPNDLLLGEIASCPFYIDQEQYERWNRPPFLIDVLPGESDTFSLEGLEGVHFVARTDAPCPILPS